MKKLKILFTNSPPLIKYGIASGFDQLGHETFVMDNKYRLWDKNKDEQLRLFKEVVDEFRPDIVFSECFVDFAESIFLYTQEKGIFHCYWAIEDLPFNHWLGSYWVNYADYVFTTSAECLPAYRNKGKKAELLLFGCNPEFHKYCGADEKYLSDAVLVANNYDTRSHQVSDFLNELIKQKYNLQVYGNEWWLDENRKFNLKNNREFYYGHLPYEELSSVYSSSKIALGFNLDDTSYTQTSMRMYEVLGCGGSLLVSYYTKSQELLFHDHIYLPKNKDEFMLIVKEIIFMTDEQRRQKAKSAQEYVYKYHNYKLRAEKVIEAYKGVI